MTDDSATKPEPLPFLAPLEQYQEQAETVLAGHRRGDPTILEFIHRHHPRFLDEKVTWLPKELEPEEIAAAPFTQSDAQLSLARGYSFLDWAALAEHVEAVTVPGSPTFRFESAVEAVIGGDLPSLETMLRDDPGLVSARSTRRTCHDPSTHRATLLHYLGANGVEGYRQKSPANAVAIATALLDAGAEVDALAGMYGGEHPTLPMLVSSDPPARAGVQLPLTETLLDRGAAIDGVGSGPWRSPLRTALVFGFRDIAEVLARRGARVDLVAAAGMGRLDQTRAMLADATPVSRHQALALAALLGHPDVVSLLLDAGEDPSRYNPEGFHSHATPLHQAALAGDAAVVTVLAERGARRDLQDTLYHGTPLDWAVYAGKTEVAELLRGYA